jgi:hypothetical protein
MKYKGILFTLFVMISFSLSAVSNLEEVDSADDTKPAASEKKYTSTDENWTVFQFAIIPGVPGVTRNSSVYGFKFGIPVSGGNGTVGGVEMSIVASTTSRVYGVQFSPFANVSDVMDGVQFCAITNATNHVAGWQMSMINVSDVAYGLQMGIVNVDTVKLKGVQMGVYNYSEEVRGVQFGIVNIAKKCGVQLGLINVIEDGWLPFFPLINVSF